MPATAGRVRMPANNRVHSSAALQTHGIWQSAIGYDPYAPNKDESKASSQNNAPDPGAENAYMSFQGLLELAKITNTNDNESRGCCKKCGRVGHLTFQCKNFISMKEEIKDKGLDTVLANGVVKLDKNKMKGSKSVEESSEEESESSDSGYDSEIERAIAKRYIKMAGIKVKDERKKNHELDGDDSESSGRKKRRRSEKRTNRKMKESDSESELEDSRRKRRKEKSGKRDKLVDDEEGRHRRRKSKNEKRRRSHHHSKDSPKRHKRALSPSENERDAKHSDKKSYKRNQDE